MRVRNITVSLNPNAAKNKAAREDGKTGRKTVFAGDLKQEKSALELRRDQARKQALKVVSDTFEGEKKLDSSMEESRRHMDELAEQNLAILDEKKAMQEKLVAEDISEEDRVEFQKAVDEYDMRMKKNNSAINGEAKALQSTHLERLKENPMVDANKTAEKLNLAASKEYAFGLMNEAKENIEKKMQENKEKGEKLQEQMEERQEALEESVEKSKERTEKASEQIEESASMAEKLSQTQSDVDEELEKIREKMKLLEEDLKGAMMDESI